MSSRESSRWVVGDDDSKYINVSTKERIKSNLKKCRSNGLAKTPHIIVSPDSEEENGQKNSDSTENLENVPEDSNDNSTTPQESTEQQQETKLAKESSGHGKGNDPTSVETDSSQGNFTKNNPPNSQVENTNTFKKGDSSRTFDHNGRGPLYNGQPPQYFPSSVSKIVIDGNSLEDSYAQEVNLKPNGSAHRSNKNIYFSSVSSISMNSLDIMDHTKRKTRKSSMLSMMKRVSSDSNIDIEQLPMRIENEKQKEYCGQINDTQSWKQSMNESFILCISALYAKLLVVMGMAFPMAEIISENVPLIFYNSFYLYLYFGSIYFLIYAYFFLLRRTTFDTDGLKDKFHQMTSKFSPRRTSTRNIFPLQRIFKNFVGEREECEEKSVSDKSEKLSISPSTTKQLHYRISESTNHGSMYLKMGAILFGIGSMIYSGLEFGQYFELKDNDECANILMAISPIGRMIFTFLQMYFIFLNSRVVISKHTTIAQFGMMHMIATNLCIWLNVLVQETKHEISYLKHKDDTNDLIGSPLGNNHLSSHKLPYALDEDDDDIDDHHNMVRRSVAGEYQLSECQKVDLLGHVVKNASPFLFPCTIEYSLLCAGVLYVMWKNIVSNKKESNTCDADSEISAFLSRKIRHHYSVDCAKASRGLFMGIFILVLTIISLILFYVLISSDQFRDFAILEANIIEVTIYSVTIISVIVGMRQMRELEFLLEGNIELDNILLIIAQAGVYVYSSFTLIGGYFSLEESDILPLITAVLALIQTTLQSLFILDGSRRCCYTTDQLDRKPGREMVTFLLVCNLAMWAVSTFETSRAEVHPTQLDFYGIWAWTIISHLSMPLAIFYRFHVTVCLGEIWKRAYKLKNEY